MNIDQYEKYAKKDKALKKFLDYNRFSIAIQYKLARNEKVAKTYIEKIKIGQLNWKQKALLYMPPFFLTLLLAIKNNLQHLKINLSAFK